MGTVGGIYRFFLTHIYGGHMVLQALFSMLRIQLEMIDAKSDSCFH